MIMIITIINVFYINFYCKYKLLEVMKGKGDEMKVYV